MLNHVYLAIDLATKQDYTVRCYYKIIDDKVQIMELLFMNEPMTRRKQDPTDT